MNSDAASPGGFCKQCGKSSANNYLCYGGKGESAVLCDECLASQDSSVARFFEEAKNAKCHFCGGSPCSGGPDFISQPTAEAVHNRWLCGSCAPEYYAFAKKAFEELPGIDEPTEQLDRMKSLAEKLEKHMKQYVRRRDN